MLDDLNNLDKFIKQFSSLTEEYRFYNGEVTLKYDVKNHIYYLLDGEELVRLDGVTTIAHIIDKSEVLVPWGCKMMGNKLINSVQEHINQEDVIIVSVADFNELVRQAKSAHKDVLEDAGNVGHVAHAWIENHIKSCLIHADDDTVYAVDVPREDERVTSCCIAAITWMANHRVRWFGTERKVYSRRFQYAGTMDGWALVDSCNDPTCCKSVFKDRLSMIDWKSGNGLWPEFLLQTAAYQQAFEEETGQEFIDRWIVRLGKEDGKFFVWHVEGREKYEEDLAAFLSALNLSRDFAIVKNRVDEEKSVISSAKKEAKKLAKSEADKIMCKKFNAYKGQRFPTCNSGTPCQACLKKYNDRHKIA